MSVKKAIPTYCYKLIQRCRVTGLFAGQFIKVTTLHQCYKLIQRFRVIGLFAGQYNTKLHGTITDVIYTIVGSVLLRD